MANHAMTPSVRAIDRAEPGSIKPSSGRRTVWCVAAGLFVATALLFAPVLLAGFSNFDDPAYVVDNMHVRQGLTLDSIRWALTTGDVASWLPLTWMSYQLDYELFGMNPAGYHLTNLLLHLANTLLLFHALRVYTGALWRSASVALLFGIHPLHVESVAWIAERKDVLSTFFWITTLLAYHRYAVRPCLSRYLTVAVSLALGLMAKPMLVTLPCVFLLLDYWPLRRLGLRSDPLLSQIGRGEAAASRWDLHSWRALVLEKLPLLALCLLCSLVTLIVQSKGGAVASAASTPIEYRLMNCADAYVAYLAKTVWPLNLAVFYPHTLDKQSWIVTLANVAVLSAITWWCFRRRFTAPYLSVGWLWYLGTLVPVIGLVQVGGQALADRYTYVPLIGIFLMAVWGLADLVAARILSGRLAAVLAIAAFLSFGACTWGQVGYWTDDVTLWKHALEVGGANLQSHHNLGGALLRQGRYKEALPYLKDLVRLAPNFASGHINMGVALSQTGETAAALEQLDEALRLEPKNVLGHLSRADILSRTGRDDEAAAELREAIAIDPLYWRAHLALSRLLHEQGEEREARAHYQEALRLNPYAAGEEWRREE